MRSAAFDSVCNDLFRMYVLFALFSVLRDKNFKKRILNFAENVKFLTLKSHHSPYGHNFGSGPGTLVRAYSNLNLEGSTDVLT